MLVAYAAITEGSLLPLKMKKPNPEFALSGTEKSSCSVTLYLPDYSIYESVQKVCS